MVYSSITFCYCEVFGPGKGVIGGRKWCKVESTVLFLFSMVDGVSTDMIKYGKWKTALEGRPYPFICGYYDERIYVFVGHA